MNHPFKIGEMYENMNGTYTVLSISPPKMTIKYENGSQSVADIEIQERIWSRIQDELAFARQEYERRTKINRPPIDFPGLAEGDFKDNVAGTNWRSRAGLAGLVSRQLSDSSEMLFTSVAIYRRPQFFVYPPHLPMFNQAEGVKLPKFVVHLSSEMLLYGFYIEKSDKEMNREWYWPLFLDLLSEEKWQEYLIRIMEEWQLKWILRFEGKVEESGSDLPPVETIISSFSEDSQFHGFSDLVVYLHELSEEKWCNLYIAKTMSKEEAIGLQTKISEPISQMLNTLVPFYSRLIHHPRMNT